MPLPLYYDSLDTARRQDDVMLWRNSFKENIRCKNAIEKALAENFDGMHLKGGIIPPLAEEYGTDRLTWVLTVRCLAKVKTGLYSEIGGNIAMAVAVLLFIRYGASLVALQGLLLYDLLLYASVSDIRTRKAEDWAWIAMIPLALCSIPRIGILSMLLGAGIVFLPQLAMAVLPPHKTLGGADIKLSTASAFLLGAVRGVGGYLVGLLASVIFTLIYNKAKGRSNKDSYPLIPFLAVGVMAAFLI